MNTYSLYRVDTGEFTGRILQCRPQHLAANVPDGCGCVVGEHDPLTQRVDLATGEVVDFVPDQPSPQHEWDAGIRRWVYVATDEDIAETVRAERDRRLAATDWRALRALETAVSLDEEWLTYRAALRDLTMQTGFPRQIDWPVSPDALTD